MKFINETGENAKYRLGSYQSGFNWHTIRPGETVDIPENIGDALKLTKIEAKQEEISEVINNESTEDDTNDVDTISQEDPEAGEKYKKKLINIDGVGKKTADEIMAKYPTEEVLKLAIQDGDEIHKRDDVDAAIKKTFKK